LIGKKGSIYLTLIIVALVLALLFINTTQNRVKNEQLNEADVKSDQIAYTFTEEMTAYASDALTTAADSAIYENAKKGFAKVIHECYSHKDPLEYDEAVTNMLEETENRINLKLAGSERDELDFGSILEVTVPDMNEHDVMQGEFDCGFSIAYLVAEESGLTKDDIGTGIETDIKTNPQQNAWAALLRTFKTYDLTNEVGLSICGAMGAVEYIARDGSSYDCPALSDTTVDTILNKAKDKLNIHADYECDDGAGANFIDCTYEELCRYVDPMGCEYSQKECFLPTNTPICDNTPANGCPCTEDDGGVCKPLPPDCTCVPAPTEPEDVACEDAHETNDTKCEVGDHIIDPETRYTEECVGGAVDVMQLLEDNGCDSSMAPGFLNGENITMYKTPHDVTPGSAAAICEMGTYDAGEVMLVLKWTCVDNNPAHCMHVEGTDPDTECLPLEAHMIQSVYMHQQAGPSLLEPVCEVPPNECDLACTGVSCFPAGTKILMGDGSEKNIEDVSVGDMVMSYDDGNVASEVLEIESPVSDNMYTLAFDDGSELRVTKDHPLMTADGWKAIEPASSTADVELSGSLGVGDEIFTSEGAYKALVDISFEAGSFQTYNLKSVENKNFFADGVLAHNKGSTHDSGGSSDTEETN